jgi:hypothetical protein
MSESLSVSAGNSSRMYVAVARVAATLIAVVLGWGMGISFTAHASSCTLTHPSGSTPQSGFGASYAPYTSAKELLLNATCPNSTTVDVEVGSGNSSMYVYQNAYYWTGTEWKLFSLSGTASGSSWLTGKGSASIPLLSNGTRYFVGYTCERVGSSWKCGCSDTMCATSKWQLQGIKDTPEPLPPDVVPNLNDRTSITTGKNRNQYFILRTTKPYKDYSIEHIGTNDFRFTVENGDLAASQTRERSELVGTDLYPWGTDVWIGFERYVEHVAQGVADVIAPQIHDDGTSGFGPPFDLQIDSQRREVVRWSYKYTVRPDQDPEKVVRDAVETGTWVKWVVHFRAGLQGGGANSSTTYGETGRLEVWRRGAADSDYVKVVDYIGDLGYEQNRGAHKFQLGIYSQGTNGAPSYDDGTDSRRTIRYRNFYSGTTSPF